MDFRLDIGELTNTINKYENFIKILAEQKENINKAVKELSDLGWSGAAKDKFLENHAKKQEFYTKLEEHIKYMENALESEEKPRAVQLKKRCEGFEACIRRSGGGAALTPDDAGLISLQYSGQAPINRNVDKCISEYYQKMESKFRDILSLLDSLSFTKFPIAGDIENARKSLKDQTTSLTDFNDSFNVYCRDVRAMEDNICSVFGKISGITEGISKFRGISVFSEGGQVDKDKVMQLMLKNPSGLTNEEKEMLAYLEKVLGEEKYAKLKEGVINGDKNQEIEEVINANRELFLNTVDNSETGTVSNVDKVAMTDKNPNFISLINSMNSTPLTTVPDTSPKYTITAPTSGYMFNPDSIQNEDLKKRVYHLVDRINNMSDTDQEDEGSYGIPVLYSRQDYINELQQIENTVNSSFYQTSNEIRNRANIVADGTLETVGGGTQVLLGGNIAIDGTIATGGIGAPLTVPAGTYLVVDGANSATEGITKVYIGFSGKNAQPTNLLRDKVYKKYLGDENGEMAYDAASAITASTCLAADASTFSKAVSKAEYLEAPRKDHIIQATKENLPTETIVSKDNNKTIYTTQVVDKGNPTPMVLRRDVIVNPIFDKSKVTPKDYWFTAIDIRNGNESRKTFIDYVNNQFTYPDSNK